MDRLSSLKCMTKKGPGATRRHAPSLKLRSLLAATASLGAALCCSPYRAPPHRCWSVAVASARLNGLIYSICSTSARRGVDKFRLPSTRIPQSCRHRPRQGPQPGRRRPKAAFTAARNWRFIKFTLRRPLATTA